MTVPAVGPVDMRHERTLHSHLFQRFDEYLRAIPIGGVLAQPTGGSEENESDKRDAQSHGLPLCSRYTAVGI